MTNDGRPKAGMTLDQAAALPCYDRFRGLLTDGGVPMERERAMIDLASVNDAGPAAGEARGEMVADMLLGHNDYRKGDASQIARDGRPLGELPAHERAREEMIRDQAGARFATAQDLG